MGVRSAPLPRGLSGLIDMYARTLDAVEVKETEIVDNLDKEVQ